MKREPVPEWSEIFAYKMMEIATLRSEIAKLRAEIANLKSDFERERHVEMGR